MLAKSKDKSLSKAQRTAVAELKKMGYQPVGYKQGSHLVMMHDTFGRMEIPHGTPPHIVVHQAHRKQKLLDNKGHRLVNAIQERLGVGDDEEVEFEGSLNQLIQEEAAKLGGEFLTARQPALLEAVRRNPRITVVRGASNDRGGNYVPGKYKIRGMFYLAPDEAPIDENEIETAKTTNRKIDLYTAQKMMNEGKSVPEIAKYFGVTRDSIYYYTRRDMLTTQTMKSGSKKNGKVIGRPRKTAVKLDLGLAQGMLRDGHTVVEVARALDVVPETIYRYVREGKLVIPHPQPWGDADAARRLHEKNAAKALTEAPKPITSADPRPWNPQAENMRGLSEYLGLKDELANTRAKIDLIEAELKDMEELFGQQAHHMEEIANLQAQINRSIETIKSL